MDVRAASALRTRNGDRPGHDIIERARVEHQGVTFIAGDFLALDLARESADVVVLLEVLAHVADQAFIAKIARTLRPRGYLMLATQNRKILERWGGVPPQVPGQIRNWVDHRELRSLHREFEILNLESSALALCPS
ncbi:MAG: class I SAM-dependent methyltransferase [Burkholderiales bacterium]